MKCGGHYLMKCFKPCGTVKPRHSLKVYLKATKRARKK